MISEQKKQVLDSYNAALALYKQRKWKEAKKAFQDTLKIDPEDGPSQMYINRCNAYIKRPPDDDWDGVFVMTTK